MKTIMIIHNRTHRAACTLLTAFVLLGTVPGSSSAEAPAEPRINTSDQLEVKLIRTIKHDEYVGPAMFIPGYAAVLTITGKYKSPNSVAHIWDVQTGKELASAPIENRGVVGVSRDGKNLYNATEAGEIVRYSLPDLKKLSTVKTGIKVANFVATSRGVFACDCQDGKINEPKPNRNLIDANTGQMVRSFGPLEATGGSFSLTTVSDDGRLAAACGWQNIYVWDVDTQRQLLKVTRTKHAQQPFYLRFVPDGSALIGTGDGLPEVLRLSDAVTTHPANGNFPQVDCPGVHHIPVGLDAAGRHYVIQAGSQVDVGDCATLTSLGRICMPGKVLTQSLSSDGSMLLLLNENTVYVFSLARPER